MTTEPTEPTEPTEEEARQLLAEAAATIDVDESTPLTLTGLSEPGPRRWLTVLGAAAAVVVAIGGGALLARELASDSAGGPEPGPAREGVAEVVVTSPGDRQDAITEEELEARMDRLAAATRFVTWARGNGPAPDFANRVRVLVPGFHAGWTDEPEDRRTYSGCSGLGFPDCRLDPVAAIANHEGRIVATAGRSSCTPGLPRERPAPRSDRDIVRLGEPERASCPTWGVELWIDRAGVIYGVGLAG